MLVSEQPFERIVTVDGNETISEYIRKCKRASKEVIFYVGDGQVTLRAESEGSGIVTCTVSKAGVIRNNKGVTIRHAKLAMTSFLSPDKRALDFLLDNGAEVFSFIAVSFVRNKDDVLKVKRHVEERLKSQRPPATDDEMSELRRAAPAIVAKIETADARDNIKSILDVADGVMIARGDLGLQFDPEEVPAIQRQLIELCNVRGKPVITATQMLESMTENPEPTRAEATDVFNAILGGTDAVMLSGETSTGRYPVQAIEMMVKIAEKAEDYYFENVPQRRFEDVREKFGNEIDATTARLSYEASEATKKSRDVRFKKDRARHVWERDLYGEKQGRSEKQETTDRISQAACSLSLRKKDSYKAIIAPTTSGRTARMISRFRPSLPIIGAAHDIHNARKLLLSFGVYPLNIGKEQVNDNLERIFDRACEEAKKPGFLSWEPSFHLLSPGDTVISTSGTPLHEPGTTNLIQIRELEAPQKDESSS